jgi:hypothetical protein
MPGLGVFISYSSHDEPIARLACERLEHAEPVRHLESVTDHCLLPLSLSVKCRMHILDNNFAVAKNFVVC